MEEKFNFDDFYTRLTPIEMQVCDLCRDWNMGDCNRCVLVEEYASKIKKGGCDKT
jgi:hypothetical protein